MIGDTINKYNSNTYIKNIHITTSPQLSNYSISILHTLYSNPEAMRTARWVSSWVLVLAFLPLVTLYSLWIYHTVTGQIEHTQHSMFSHSTNTMSNKSLSPIKTTSEDDEDNNNTSTGASTGGVGAGTGGMLFARSASPRLTQAQTNNTEPEINTGTGRFGYTENPLTNLTAALLLNQQGYHHNQKQQLSQNSVSFEDTHNNPAASSPSTEGVPPINYN